MKRKQIIIVLIYVLLLLGCLSIVLIIGHFAGDNNKDWTQQRSESTAFQSEEGNGQELPEDIHTPADAGMDESQATEAAAGNQHWRPQHAGLKEEPIPELPQEPYIPPVIMVSSDHHYISATMHDDGKAFWKMVQDDDGKINQYSDAMIDTLVAEAITNHPSALVLAGDLTLNGELENHQKLAEKLRVAQEAGVPVLVVPGNHDINNQNAAIYFGTKREKAEYLAAAEDFLEIYHEFGYDQSLSRDPNSLSYVYVLDEKHWLIMLDSCQYEDYNHVNGKLKPETLAWLEEQLTQASLDQIAVLPIGHHNLLSESRMYTTECTMEDHNQVVDLLGQYQVPLYISGHLHAQRIKKHKAAPGVSDEDYGITEIVLSGYAIAPNQYGWLTWDEQDNMAFSTRQADVAGFAASQGSEDENLLHFDTYGSEFVKQILAQQVEKTISSVPDDLKAEMAELFTGLYYDYCAGNQMSWDTVKTTKSYLLWQRVSPDSTYVRNMGQMIADTKEDMHDWNWRQPETDEQGY